MLNFQRHLPDPVLPLRLCTMAYYYRYPGMTPYTRYRCWWRRRDGYYRRR